MCFVLGRQRRVGLGEGDFDVRWGQDRVARVHAVLFEEVGDVARLVQGEGARLAVARNVHAEDPFERALVGHGKTRAELVFDPFDRELVRCCDDDVVHENCCQYGALRFAKHVEAWVVLGLGETAGVHEKLVEQDVEATTALFEAVERGFSKG